MQPHHRKPTVQYSPITANPIASLLLSNGRSTNADKDFARKTSATVHELSRAKKATEWLRSFLSTCLKHLKLPKIWRRAKVIALPKPNKPNDDPKGYRPISLLCVPYKLLERLILARLYPVIDPQLPKEQAGFRSGMSTTDQVTLLCQDIEDSFQSGEKAGTVFLDLTAA